MLNQNFTAIGRIPGECLFVHKDNVGLLPKYGYTGKVKCIAIDFNSGRISDPVIIDVLLRFCSHSEVSSEGERQVISDLVRESLSKETIVMLNKKFEEIKYQE